MTPKQKLARKLAIKKGHAIYARRKVIVETVFGADEPVAGEESVDELFAAPFRLVLAEPVQFDRLRAAGEAVAGGRQAEQVSGSGDQEPSESTVLVDEELEREDEFGHALNFVDGQQRAWFVGQEPDGVCLRGGASHLVIEGDHSAADLLHDLADQVGLADLPGTLNDHDPGVVQCLQGAGATCRSMVAVTATQ